MIKPTALATMILIAEAASAFAQGGNPAPTPQGTRPPIIGQTGTMYDGNNTNLQLPFDQNAYWARLWAEPGTTGNSGPGSAVGAGAAGTSLGGAQTGGQH